MRRPLQAAVRRSRNGAETRCGQISELAHRTLSYVSRAGFRAAVTTAAGQALLRCDEATPAVPLRSPMGDETNRRQGPETHPAGRRPEPETGKTASRHRRSKSSWGSGRPLGFIVCSPCPRSAFTRPCWAVLHLYRYMCVSVGSHAGWKGTIARAGVARGLPRPHHPLATADAQA